jgi:CubicO group peptidase (beta-lactamase class C family)
MKIRLIPLLVVWAGFVAAGFAQDRFAGVPAALQPFVDQGEISGAVMLVADKDRVLHLSAVGVSDLATGRRMATDDIFWIASMTKPVTAVAVALLVDDGKLSFDDPVEKFLPEFGRLWVAAESTKERRVLVPAARPLTLRDLLTHTGGIGEYPASSPHWTLAERSLVVAREPLRFQPGTQWNYSTPGIDVLGRVVEVVSGLPFSDFLQRRLFDPLGMKETSFWLTAETEARCAHNYGPNAQSGRLEEVPIHYLYGAAATDRARPPLGGAGLFSTAADVAKFYQMMLNHGLANGHRILQPATVAELIRNQTGTLKARPGMPWGLGFCIVEDPSQAENNRHFNAGTFGHGGAHGTQSWADPVTGVIQVFMIQRAGIPGNPDNSPMRLAFHDAVAAALANPRAAAAAGNRSEK